MEVAATSVGASVGHGVGVTRDLAGQTFSKELLGRVFNAKPGEVFVTPDNRLGAVLVKLERISPPPPAEIATQLAAARQQTSRSMLASIGEAIRIAARREIKPNVDYKRAREAAGGSGTTPAQPAS